MEAMCYNLYRSPEIMKNLSKTWKNDKKSKWKIKIQSKSYKNRQVHYVSDWIFIGFLTEIFQKKAGKIWKITVGEYCNGLNHKKR